MASNNNPSLTHSCVYFQIFKEIVEELREIVDQQTKTFRTQVSVNKGSNVIDKDKPDPDWLIGTNINITQVSNKNQTYSKELDSDWLIDTDINIKQVSNKNQTYSKGLDSDWLIYTDNITQVSNKNQIYSKGKGLDSDWLIDTDINITQVSNKNQTYSKGLDSD